MVAYIVKKGDTLYKIAEDFGVSLNVLIRANPQITHPSMIFPGQIIYVPLKKDHPRFPKKIKCVIPYMPDYLMRYMPYYHQMQPNMYPNMQPFYSNMTPQMPNGYPQQQPMYNMMNPNDAPENSYIERSSSDYDSSSS